MYTINKYGMDSTCIKETNFKFPGQARFYKGKVRDVYYIEDQLVMVVSDRISAFDHVLPKPIPYKGQVLNQIAAYFLNATKDIVPNWLDANPDPNVSIGKKCEPIRIEMVVRGYLAGHAWRTYNSGERMLCGVKMPDGMSQNDPFPYPIITPTSKADAGHDEDISEEEILIRGIVTNEVWDKLKAYTLALYHRGQQMTIKQGLILVDTKYEFGIHKGEIVLMDEIHTPDSSRYFYKDGYEERQQAGKPQRQLSKEFVREWLMENGFQGKDGQTMPIMPEEFVQEVSNRYIHLYELITGQDFIKDSTMNIMERVEKNVLTYLQNKNLK